VKHRGSVLSTGLPSPRFEQVKVDRAVWLRRRSSPGGSRRHRRGRRAPAQAGRGRVDGAGIRALSRVVMAEDTCRRSRRSRQSPRAIRRLREHQTQRSSFALRRPEKALKHAENGVANFANFACEARSRRTGAGRVGSSTVDPALTPQFRLSRSRAARADRFGAHCLESALGQELAPFVTREVAAGDCAGLSFPGAWLCIPDGRLGVGVADDDLVRVVGECGGDPTDVGLGLERCADLGAGSDVVEAGAGVSA
jgi:hypothetical protein